MIDRLSFPLGGNKCLELVSFEELADEELAQAGADLCRVVKRRPELAENYPQLPEVYKDPKNAAKRLKVVRSAATAEFIPKLLVKTRNGLFLSAEGVATAKDAKPGIKEYEKQHKPSPENRRSEAELQAIYDRLKTNVTFWCAKEVLVELNGGREVYFSQDPIAGRLVDLWGRELDNKNGGVYTLLAEHQFVDQAIDPTQILLEYGWRGTGVGGLCKLTGAVVGMEVVAPS